MPYPVVRLDWEALEVALGWRLNACRTALAADLTHEVRFLVGDIAWNWSLRSNA
jgi:hypothetical protein